MVQEIFDRAQVEISRAGKKTRIVTIASGCESEMRNPRSPRSSGKTVVLEERLEQRLELEAQLEERLRLAPHLKANHRVAEGESRTAPGILKKRLPEKKSPKKSKPIERAGWDTSVAVPIYDKFKLESGVWAQPQPLARQMVMASQASHGTTPPTTSEAEGDGDRDFTKHVKKVRTMHKLRTEKGMETFNAALASQHLGEHQKPLFMRKHPSRNLTLETRQFGKDHEQDGRVSPRLCEDPNAKPDFNTSVAAMNPYDKFKQSAWKHSPRPM